MECPYCKHGHDYCDEHYRMYGCTQEKGHSGDHVACGFRPNEHPIITWPAENAPTKTDAEQQIIDAA